MKDCGWCVIRRWNRLPNRGNAGIPYPVGDMRGVFLPLIFWCLKMGENGGFGMLHLVGFNTDVKTPLNHHTPFSLPIPDILCDTSPMNRLLILPVLLLTLLVGNPAFGDKNVI